MTSGRQHERACGIATLIVLAVFLFALSAIAATNAGCTSTVTPEIVTPTQASYSGATRNSGIISREAGGWIVDGTFRLRYDALIEAYGDEYNVRRDEGITQLVTAKAPEDERWKIDHRHFVLMVTMNIKKHSGIAPTK